MPLSFFFFFFFFFLSIAIKPTSKKDQRKLLPVVKHLRTDGPQPIVPTSDADNQRLSVGGRPWCRRGPSNGRLKMNRAKYTAREALELLV